MSDALSISISGMNAAVTRVANAANNIANATTTGKLPSAAGEKATSYQPTDVIALSVSDNGNNFGVTTKTIERTPAYNVAYSPTSPDANEKGLIAEPNIDVVKEIVDLELAKIAYAASAKVIAAEKENNDALLSTI